VTATLAVIAKAPSPGRSKTRLSPPLSLDEAALLARAALSDTLAAAVATPAGRHVLVLDGEPGPWLPSGMDVIPQRGAGLDERLANAFVDLEGPTLIIGMDTPQVVPSALGAALRALDATPALLGPAVDGGYWAIGLRRPDRRALLGVAMSTSRTLTAQRRRLEALGLSVGQLRTLRDVDTYADAVAVALDAPSTRFAAALAAIAGRSAAA